MAIVIGGIGGLMAAVGSLLGVIHLHARSQCCGRKVNLDIGENTPPTSATSATPLVTHENKIESEKS